MFAPNTSFIPSPLVKLRPISALLSFAAIAESKLWNRSLILDKRNFSWHCFGKPVRINRIPLQFYINPEISRSVKKGGRAFIPIATANGIGCSDDRAPRKEGRDDACL